MGRCLSTTQTDMQQPTTTPNLPGVPRPDLVTRLMDRVYDTRYLSLIPGKQFLVAKYKSTGHGIFIVNGNFGRDAYKVCVQEAKDAGLSTRQLTVFGVTATYSGRSIDFRKFDEIGVIP